MKKLNKVICSVLLCGAFFIPTISVSAEKAPAVTTVTSSEVVSTEELPVTSITESEKTDDTAKTTEISKINDNEDKTVSDETSSLPEGNGALLEDVSDDVVNRQFLSIQSKNGNTFYIVIDKDSKGKQNVYFMNLVDEYDLMDFAENFPEEVQSELKDGTESSSETDKDGNTVKSDENQTDKDTKTKSGGGAFYYFKVVKPKKCAKAPKQPDYGDEDEDYEEDTVNEDVSDEDEEV
jgi:hypothetical protein